MINEIGDGVFVSMGTSQSCAVPGLLDELKAKRFGPEQQPYDDDVS